MSKIKKSKKSKKSKKGGIGERAVARMITKWITGKEEPEVVWRASTSGGKATRSKLKIHTMLGDIVSIDARSAFLPEIAVIEVKNRKQTNVLDLLSDDAESDCFKLSKGKKTQGQRVEKSSLFCWWLKLWSIADKAGKIPILMFKRYQSKNWYMVFDMQDFTKLRVLVKFKEPVLQIANGDILCSIINSTAFFENVTVEDFKKCYRYNSRPRMKFQRLWNYAEIYS